MSLETALADIIVRICKLRETFQRGLVATDLNNVLKKALIRLPAEVAGLTFDKDLVVEF